MPSPRPSPIPPRRIDLWSRHLYLYEAVNDTYFTATEDDRVISVMSEAQAKEWARDQLYPRDYDALCDGLWWYPV